MNAPPSAPEPDLSGTVLAGRYRVIRKLGAGGMGSVYLGEHTTIRKQLAIKVLAAKLANQPELVARFLREARATSLISQHNVIEISDFGETPDGSVFFVMEYLEGEDLRALRKREKRLPWPRVRHLSLQICQALEAAHAAGVVHRDVKPDNCFRVTRGDDPDFIKVLDFGIAKIQGGEGEGEGKGLTRTGMIMGTAKYMAPEQAQGSSNDPRVDIYAVGIIMYELLCGRVPFSGKNMVEVLKKHIFKPPKPLRERCPEAGIPVAAEAVVLKALQKDPAHRFASMTEMIAAIEAVGTDAAPVEVVAEHIAEPELGALSFADGSSPSLSGSLSAAGLSSVSQPVVSEPEPSSKLLWLGLGGLALAAGLVAVAVLGGKDDALASAEADQAAPAEPTEQPEPAPASAPADREQPPDEPPPAAPVSTLHFHTNVPVRVLGTDRAVYGRSDDEGGVELPRSDEAVALILAAEGYEELEIEVVPNRETKHYEYELQAIGAKRKQGKQRRSKRDEPEPVAPEPASKQAPSDAPDSELMNPFD